MQQTTNSPSASSTKYSVAPSKCPSSVFKHALNVYISSSTLLTIFGGRVDDLRSIVLHERIPEGWESRIRQPYGLTMTHFNKTVLAVEFGVREKDWEEAAQEAARHHAASV